MNPVLWQTPNRQEEPANEMVAQLIYLKREEVEEICKELDAVALIEEVFRLKATGEIILPDEAYLSWKNKNGEPVRSLNMPAYVGGRIGAAGTKIINSNIANPKRGLPRASGLTLLFDEENVRVTCVMEGACISALRTAAVSAMSVKLLGNAPIHSASIIGTGVIGATHLELMTKVFPSLQRIVLFDLNREQAEPLAESMRVSTAAIEVALSAEEAVRSSQVVIAATTVTSGYIKYEWLNRGSVIVNVSLDDLLPEVFLKADKLFVDDWNLVCEDSRRLLGKMHREGLIAGPRCHATSANGRKVDGELCDVVAGLHPGRIDQQEIVVVNPFGLAIEDIAFAARIFEIAQMRGIGTPLSA
jgi:ornithine cyclodeaminase/alanine dehydrogenase-like protein (mu-crystallin family)